MTPEFEAALVELATLLQAQQPQAPQQTPNDAMAANIERQSGQFPRNMQVRPPEGMDVLGRKQVEARPRDMGTTELITNALGDPKWTNALYNMQPVIDAGPQIAKETYNQTITEPANALVDATRDPSVANLTNAGVRTALALAPFKPGPMIKATAGITAAGLGTAGTLDALNATSQPVEAADNDPVAQIDARMRQIQTELAKKPASSVRRTLENEASQLAQTKAAILTKSATTGIESEATTKRDTELRQNKARDVFNTSMEDYEASRKPGQLMETINKLGVLAPAAGAALGGAITRMSHPNAGLVRQYVAGVLPAFTLANAKPGEAYLNEPVENPERTAYKKASRVLADTDPLKAQYDATLQNVPVTNPLREAARNDLQDWRNQLQRSAIAGLEGTAAFTGFDLASGLGRLRKAPADMARTVGEVPGALQEGRNIGMQRANAVNQTPQSPLSPQHQELVADAWLTRNAPNNVIPGQQGFRTQAEMRAYALQQLGVNQQQPQAPQPRQSMPAPTSNALRNIAMRIGIPTAGVGLGYGLNELTK